VRIYPYFYRFLQNFISIGKQEQSFFTQIEKLLLDKKSNYKYILDVGCADGIFLEKVNIPRSIKYIGIDLESVLIRKANFKYKKKI
jgi:2-polyprenyl-3-methyl-5-hydroxy-6-metoxy-1,4-benzoquinol methylase